MGRKRAPKRAETLQDCATFHGQLPNGGEILNGEMLSSIEWTSTALTGDVLVNTTVLGGQRLPSIDSNSSGEFVVAWRDDALYGTEVDGWPERNCTLSARLERRSVDEHPDDLFEFQNIKGVGIHRRL